MKEITHDNGLSLKIPDTLESKKTQSGFFITPKGQGAVRSPTQVEINFVNNPHKPQDWKSQKEINNRTVYYREEEVTEGSGGTEYILETSIPIANGYIETMQDVQQEFSTTPDFSLTWQVISQAAVSNSAK